MNKIVFLILFLFALPSITNAQEERLKRELDGFMNESPKEDEESLKDSLDNYMNGSTEEDDDAEPAPQDAFLRIDWLTNERVSSTEEFNVKIGIITSKEIQDCKIKVRKVKYSTSVTRGTKIVKKDGYNHIINEVVKLKHNYNNIYVIIKINGKWYRSESICVTFDPNGKFDKRIALVIGNTEYKNGWDKLPNAQNDATAIAEKLKSLGFKVDNAAINLDKDAFQKKLSDFKRESADYDIALFYYAGHGTQDSEGKGNFLIPVDVTTANDNDLMQQCINAEKMVQEDIGGKKKIIILDACRSNMAYEPHAIRGGTRNKVRGRGFMEMDSPAETLILYSTGKNKSAYDGDGKGKHSYFAKALLNSLEESDLTLSDIINYVTAEVKKKTENLETGIQEPYRSGSYSLLDYFVFNKSY